MRRFIFSSALFLD